jgi:cytochrome c oxidase assembly factor CtaG
VFVLASGHIGGPVLSPLQIAPAVCFGVLYHVRARTLAAQGKPVEQRRQVCWYGGLVLIAATLSSPLGNLDGRLFLAHMSEHLLIGDIGSLLLVMGLTGPLLAPVLRTPLLGWLRHLAHPAPAFLLWAVNLLSWHLVAPQQAAVHHDGIHAIQHLLFVGLGMNMWMALFGPLPKPIWFGNLAKLVYIVGVRFVTTALSNVFVWSDHPFYPVYRAGERSFGISPSTDQVVAGSIMMVEGSILTICLFCWLFLRSAKEGEERQELLDLAASAGVALTEQRAARAVAAGRGAELRRRIEDGA